MALIPEERTNLAVAT